MGNEVHSAFFCTQWPSSQLFCSSSNYLFYQPGYSQFLLYLISLAHVLPVRRRKLLWIYLNLLPSLPKLFYPVFFHSQLCSLFLVHLNIQDTFWNKEDGSTVVAPHSKSMEMPDFELPKLWRHSSQKPHWAVIYLSAYLELVSSAFF